MRCHLLTSNCSVTRTQGWPAALCLAALSLRSSSSANRHDRVATFGASNRHLVDFFAAEVLSVHPPATQEFMLKCSILERLCGPLCNALLEAPRTGDCLAELSRSNLFLVPDDDEGGWYHFHPLVAQLLRTELTHRHSGLATTLHRRAFQWHRDHGNIDEAFDHAVQASMLSEAADLVADNWLTFVNTGKHTTALRWLKQLPEATTSTDLRLLMAQAWVQYLSGQPEDSASTCHRAEELLAAGTDGVLDLHSCTASLVTLRAFQGGAGDAAHQQALRAVEEVDASSPWRSAACLAMGLATYRRGDLAQAGMWFIEAVSFGTASRQWGAAYAALGYRSRIAGRGGHVQAQARLAELATAMARGQGLQDFASSPLLAPATALTAQGNPDEALPVVEHVVAVPRSRQQPRPHAAALRHHACVPTDLEEHEPSAAPNVESRSHLEICPDPDVRAKPAIKRRPRGWQRLSPGREELTPREKAVLELLAEDLSEAAIGRKLFVSHNTVHSHIRSIFRKLGASKRVDAVNRARLIGIL